MTNIPDGYEDLLERPNFGHLATVRPDGNPAVTPMWFSWDGELLRFTHTTRRAKLRNIEHNPHVSLSVLDPEKPYRYLQARGVVESITPDPTGAFYVELAHRYGRPDPAPPPDSPDRVVIAVRPFAYSKQ
ncbi:PPOX class F420-dependent oxidoreductase [Pseudonocardia acaciae]|uniref:PPOX class F420-dependent oxidoreductase n=1 Tax=Pseudonocardia acaciae TaxID=551276 RepID=UPI0004911185|nr:PPOX class F420-dependent oxidoreductase [Pseudonocardia acaciae]